MTAMEASQEAVTEVSIEVVNKKGVHARAAAKFVKTAALYNAHVMVAKIAGSGVAAGSEPHEVSASSILGLMMLGAEYHSTLRLRISGEQASEAMEALTMLIAEKFGEEE